MYTLATLAALLFLTISPILNLFITKSKQNLAYLVLGVVAALILAELLPGGVIELALLIGLIGTFLSFYKIYNQSFNYSNEVIFHSYNVFRFYWVLSGFFIFASILLLVEFLKNNDTNKTLIAIIIVLLLPIVVLLSRRLSNLHYEFKIFAISLLMISVPEVFRELSSYNDMFVHGIMHLNYTTFMFPDHPFLDIRFYILSMNTVEDSTFVAFSTFAFLSILPIVLLVKFYWRKINPPGNSFPVVEKRLKLSIQRNIWRTKVIITIFIIFITFFSALFRHETETGEATQYFPVRAKSGYITISTSEPMYQISEGQIKKYRYEWQGNSINFIVFRWKGKLKTVIDFCEFCKGEKEGYYLKASHLVCAVCQTPISPETIGTPGGCNPVPLKARVSKFTVQIKESDLKDIFVSKRGK